MKLHWKILVWLLAGVAVGIAFQVWLDAWPTSGFRVTDAPGGAGAQVTAAPAGSAIASGDVITGVIAERGTDRERSVDVTDRATYEAAVASSRNGDVLWHRRQTGPLVPVTLALAADSPRAIWLRPFNIAADLFLRLLKMLIVPIILTSIITGVSSLGGGDELKRLGKKTALYYLATSTLAAITGLTLVNLIRPGVGARLGLTINDAFSEIQETRFSDVLVRMIPENVFAAFGDNINMLQVIFFSLLFGYFILRSTEPHRGMMTDFFQAAFEVVMKLATFVLSLIPYGVFALLVRVVASTGLEVFKPLGLFMLTVTIALLVHTLITLPLILRLVGGINPIRWIRAMTPAWITAFSTSSSSMTLPVSLETVEHRGKVSNKIVSFVQPLGATINMDGTALYEGIGVIFLAQYYASIGGFELTVGAQVLVVFMALLASVGAAGIPSAGLIMMVTILSALDLPVEGAALLLAIDRPLDMLRTATNVFSDTCGSAVIARSEGETGPLEAG